MNISDVSSNSGQLRPQMRQQPLTDEQKETISSILSKYDPSNMSEEDKESMRNELKDANIKPSKELGKILNDAGFAPSAPPPPPPPSKSKMQGENQNNMQDNFSIDEILNKLSDMTNKFSKGNFIDTEI